MNTKGKDEKLSAIIAKNDALIKELEELRLLNEKETKLYHLIESRPFSYSKSFIKTEKPCNSEIHEANQAVDRVYNEAAKIIQKAYRRYLFDQRCLKRFQKWSSISPKKSIDLIDKVSQRIKKKSPSSKQDFYPWKHQSMKFNQDRHKRAKTFEKRNQLINEVLKEKGFLANEALNAHELRRLQLYQETLAIQELQSQLQSAEDEAFISTL